MNRRWTVAVGALIGLLMVGQVVTLRYALAAGANRNIADARTALLAAQDALAEATKSYQVETASWNALNKMPLTETEHQMANLMAQSATTQKAVLSADRNCLKALQDLLQQIGRENGKN
jgi:pyruvate/2-oxoglutarate dehydrogenase complex dihydrolipoamide acyltransferase (E2) component